MLALTRKVGESVVIGNGMITVTVVDIRGDRVKLSFEAPNDMPIHRAEIQKLVDLKKG